MLFLPFLEFDVPNERHAHAAGTAPAAGELAAWDFQHGNTVAFQDLVGDVVPVVSNDHAGADAQGVGAVIPLLPLGGNLVLAAAEDQGDLVLFC